MRSLYQVKHRIWLPWFTTRLVLFLFYLSILSFLLYLLGSFQDFAVTSQFFLYNAMNIIFYVFFSAAVINIFILILIPGRRKKSGVLFYIKYSCMILLVAGMYVIISFLFKIIEKVN